MGKRSVHLLVLLTIFSLVGIFIILIKKYEPQLVSKYLVLAGTFITLSLIFIYIIIATIIRQRKNNQIRDDLINNLTHEFKTPISTIYLAAEVLLQTNEYQQKRVKKYASIILDENKRMRNQIDRILQMSALENGDFRIEKQQIDMHELLQKLVTNLCLEHCDTNVNLHFYLNATNPIIIGDTLHLSNVIINLVNNAIKYSQNNPGIIIKSRNNSKSFIFSIEDLGIGIKKEHLKSIFNKYYRVPTGNIHNVKGFGIGLYYVKKIIELHKGNVKVFSELDKGTKFEIILPQENLKTK